MVPMAPSVPPPSFHPMPALADPEVAPPFGAGIEASHAAAPVKRSKEPDKVQPCFLFSLLAFVRMW